MPKYNLFFTNETGSVKIGTSYETISANDTKEAITLFLEKVNSFQKLNKLNESIKKSDNRPYIAISCEPFSSIEIQENPDCFLHRDLLLLRSQQEFQEKLVDCIINKKDISKLIKSLKLK
jgi:hypothetical protein